MKEKKYNLLPADTEHIASIIVDMAFRIHKALGPGLLESVYEKCLIYELNKQQIPFKSQVVIPIKYDELI
jgi:GxxExxY protein